MWLFKTALLQSMENRSEKIRQPQHTDDIRLLGDRQRLIISQNKLIDGLIQCCICLNVFSLGGRIHKFFAHYMNLIVTSTCMT